MCKRTLLVKILQYTVMSLSRKKFDMLKQIGKRHMKKYVIERMMKVVRERKGPEELLDNVDHLIEVLGKTDFPEDQ